MYEEFQTWILGTGAVESSTKSENYKGNVTANLQSRDKFLSSLYVYDCDKYLLKSNFLSFGIKRFWPIHVTLMQLILSRFYGHEHEEQLGNSTLSEDSYTFTKVRVTQSCFVQQATQQKLSANSDNATQFVKSPIQFTVSRSKR